MKTLLIDDHRDVDAILQRLFTAFDRSDLAEVRKVLDYFWARLAMHIRAENTHLFPAVLREYRTRLQSGPALDDIEKTICRLHNDHDFFMRELGAAVKELFDLTNDPPLDQKKRLAELREKIDAVRDRLEEHNEAEEAGVYEWGELLDEANTPDLRNKIRKELEKLPPRFQKKENE